MRRWKPQFSPGVVIALVLLLLALVGTAYFGYQLFLALGQPPEAWPVSWELYSELVGFLGMLFISGTLAYRLLSRLTMAYTLDRNGLYISWLGNRAVVPMTQIESIDSGGSGMRLPWRPVQGIGYYWGEGRTGGGRPLHLFTTRHPKHALLVHTAGASYAISPNDAGTFVQDLEQLRRLGVIQQLNATVERGRFFFYDFWKDRTVRLALLLTLFIALLSLGLLALRYPMLPPIIELRFNAAGEVVDLRPKYQVLFLPMAALVVSLMNLGLGLSLYQRQPAGARLLQLGSVLVQFLFSVAIFSVLLR
ncbi:MAG: PH domain-containing protein [Chloroflexaceae bacterium]|jgi:hypothetical protein|nr:PH domain-containing protein [Chloroflexaceae bacterium]